MTPNIEEFSIWVCMIGTLCDRYCACESHLNWDVLEKPYVLHQHHLYWARLLIVKLLVLSDGIKYE